MNRRSFIKTAAAATGCCVAIANQRKEEYGYIKAFDEEERRRREGSVCLSIYLSAPEWHSSIQSVCYIDKKLLDFVDDPSELMQQESKVHIEALAQFYKQNVAEVEGGGV